MGSPQQIVFPAGYDKIHKIPQDIEVILKTQLMGYKKNEDGSFTLDETALNFDYFWIFPILKDGLRDRVYLFIPSKETKKGLKLSHMDFHGRYKLEPEIRLYKGNIKIMLILEALNRKYPGKIALIQIPPKQVNPFFNSKTGTSKCIFCGQHFKTDNHAQRYCNVKCRRGYYIEIRRVLSDRTGRLVPQTIEKLERCEPIKPTYLNNQNTCLYCQKPLPNDKRSNRRFCDSTCRGAYHRMNKKIVLG